MYERYRLPVVHEADLLLALTDDVIDGEHDPNHKQWFSKFKEYNPMLAGELLHQAAEDSRGDQEQFDTIIRILAYAIHALEMAGERTVHENGESSHGGGDEDPQP